MLTLLANITKRPPLWGLSYEAAKTLGTSLRADGSKAQRELATACTLVQLSEGEAVYSHMAKDTRQDAMRAVGTAR